MPYMLRSEPNAPAKPRASPPLMAKGRCKLVLHDLRDDAHRAFLHAVAAGDAGVFVLDGDHAVFDDQDVLRALIDADAAADAFIDFKYRTRHVELLIPLLRYETRHLNTRGANRQVHDTME